MQSKKTKNRKPTQPLVIYLQIRVFLCILLYYPYLKNELPKIVSLTDLMLFLIEFLPPKLVAWCSDVSNQINIMDLDTKQEFATFDGVQVSNPGKITILNVLVVIPTLKQIAAGHTSKKFQIRTCWCLFITNSRSQQIWRYLMSQRKEK